MYVCVHLLDTQAERCRAPSLRDTSSTPASTVMDTEVVRPHFSFVETDGCRNFWGRRACCRSRHRRITVLLVLVISRLLGRLSVACLGLFRGAMYSLLCLSSSLLVCELGPWMEHCRYHMSCRYFGEAWRVLVVKMSFEDVIILVPGTGHLTHP